MAVTICSADRYFLRFKRITTYLKSIGENRLNSLTRQSIVSKLMSKIDFQDLIEKFAHLKNGKNLF